MATLRQWDARDIDFFEQVTKISGQERDLRSYCSIFRSKGNLLTGDITPNYSFLTGEQIGEIGAQFPYARIILLVRDPVARAWSHISMISRIGRFNERLLGKPAKFRQYLEKSRALRNLSITTKVAWAWAENAPQVAFRHFFFDDIAGDPENIRREVLLYFGADPDKASGALGADFNRKSKKFKLDLPDDVKAQLVEHFEGELRESAALFGGPAQEVARSIRFRAKCPGC